VLRSGFLRKMILSKKTAKVRLAHKSQGLDAAARYERVREIEFYKSRGFHYREPENTADGVISLYKDLSAKSGA
jgi:hypothetical protein